jgi:Ca2+-transporting ATPase
VTDSLPAIALGMDKTETDIMKRKSGANNKSLFSGGLGLRIGLEGCMIGMLALLAFGIGVTFFDSGDAVDIGRTMAFATLSMTQLVHAFNMRTDKSIFSIDIFDNHYLVGALIAGVILQVSVIMIEPVANIFKVVPLSPACWLVVLLLCLMPIALVELEKYLGRLGIRRKLAYAVTTILQQ